MVSMANHLLQVEKAWLLSQIGALYTCCYKLALLIQQSYVFFKVLSPTAMMMSWTKYVSVNFRYGAHTITEPYYSIAKMEFLLLVTFTGVCENAEGTTSRFARRENKRRITSSRYSLCESVHP